MQKKQTHLNDNGAKVVCQQPGNISFQLCEHTVANGLASMPNHTLGDVIAVLRFREAKDVAIKLFTDGALLLNSPAFDAALNDTACVVAKNNVIHFASHRCNDFCNEHLPPFQGSFAITKLVPLQNE